MNNNMNKKTENFLSIANPVHATRYDLSKVNYISNEVNVKIICPEHGVFRVKASELLSNKILCPKCRHDANIRIKNKKNEENIANYGLACKLNEEEENFAANVIKGRGLCHIDVHKEQQDLHFQTITFFLNDERVAIHMIPEKYFVHTKNNVDEYTQRLNRFREMITYYKSHRIDFILFNENHEKILNYPLANNYDMANEMLDEIINTHHERNISNELFDYLIDNNISMGDILLSDKEVKILFNNNNNDILFTIDNFIDISCIGKSYGFNNMSIKQNKKSDEEELLLQIILNK